MPFALVFLALIVTLVVHAVRTGRASPWAFILILAPGIGALAYIAAVLIPDWLGSAQARRARQKVSEVLDPEKRYRARSDAVEIADTIANRAALADECLGLGRFDEAKRHYGVILSRPIGDDPVYMLGLARAEFGLGEADAAVATLDALRAQWPDWQSADGHLLYARALEACGRSDDALDEYRALSDYFPGAEARVRYGLLLQRLGRDGEARVWLTDVVTRLRRAPDHVRVSQREWITVAEKALRA